MRPAPLIQDSLLCRWFFLLVALSAFAALQGLLVPRWPRAQDLPAALLLSSLTKAGLNPNPLTILPAVRSYERSLSPILGWKLSDGSELRIVHGSVRQRKTFQTSFLGRDQPSLSLVSRRLDIPTPSCAAGLIKGRPAYQTCLLSGSAGLATMAITAEALGKAADQQVAGPIDTVKGLLGLQPTRKLRCILVSLRSATTEPPAVKIWRDILASVSSTVHK